MIQAHEQVVIPQTFFAFVLQYEIFPVSIFNEIIFIIVILMIMTLMLSFLKTLTIIIDGFELNATKVKKFRCICNNNKKIPIANATKFLENIYN